MSGVAAASAAALMAPADGTWPISASAACRRQHRPVTHAQQRNSRGGTSPLWRPAHRRGDAHQRKVAVPARDFLKGEAFAARRGRNEDLGQQFSRLNRGGEEAHEEVIGLHRARAELLAKAELARSSASITAGSSAAGSACARLPPIGASVTYRRVRDEWHGLCDQRRPFATARLRSIVRWRVMPPIRKPFDSSSDIGKLAQRIQIDQDRGSGQPEVHRRNQALPPRKRLRIVRMRSKQRQRLIKRLRPVIVERRWFHCSVGGTSRPAPAAPLKRPWSSLFSASSACLRHHLAHRLQEPLPDAQRCGRRSARQSCSSSL